MSDRLIINQDAMKHVQAYIDYRNIVGEDDGGKMMNDQEFEAYKKKVAEARKNHLYVYWINIKNYDCKAIGPESQCFCGHRYKAHDFDAVKTKKVKCKTSKCKCPLFNYVPVYGSNDVKCLCKHSHTLHDPLSKKCVKPGCICSYFSSKFTCNCTYQYDDHVTMIETRQERISQGKQVDPGWMTNNLTAGIGGLNSFTSMVNDVYGLEYNALMNDPEKKLALMGDFENKADNNTTNTNIGYSNQIVKKSGNKIMTTGTTAYELFNKPHKYGKGKFLTSGNQDTNTGIKQITGKIGRLALKK